MARRHILNGNLSMAVLNRLDKRAAALDDRAIALARSIGAAFEDFIALVLDGGKADAIAAFLKAHPDPLAALVEAAAAREHAPAPILVEKSAIFSRHAMLGRPEIDPITAPTPCSCPADRELALLDAA